VTLRNRSTRPRSCLHHSSDRLTIPQQTAGIPVVQFLHQTATVHPKSESSQLALLQRAANGVQQRTSRSCHRILLYVARSAIAASSSFDNALLHTGGKKARSRSRQPIHARFSNKTSWRSCRENIVWRDLAPSPSALGGVCSRVALYEVSSTAGKSSTRYSRPRRSNQDSYRKRRYSLAVGFGQTGRRGDTGALSSNDRLFLKGIAKIRLLDSRLRLTAAFIWPPGHEIMPAAKRLVEVAAPYLYALE
jgi:hypothetical protein